MVVVVVVVVVVRNRLIKVPEYTMCRLWLKK